MSFPFSVNGSPLDGSSMPALKYQGASFSIESIDSANTGRNQQGLMIRDMIGEKIKWTLEFAPCTTAQMNTLINAVGNKASFSFTYPNPRGGGTATGTFYVGARSAPVWKVNRNSSGVGLWGNLTMDFIEM